MIRWAYRRARTCKDVAAGNALLRQLLGPPGNDRLGRPRPAEQLTLMQHTTRLRRRLGSLGKEVGLVEKRVKEGDPIAAEVREEMCRELRLSANQLTTLERDLKHKAQAPEEGVQLH